MHVVVDEGWTDNSEQRDGGGGVGSRPWDPHGDPVAPQHVTWRDLSWEELLSEAERVGPDPRFAEFSDSEVIERLAVGAAQIDAAMCRWLELLAEFTVRRVWADEGARTAGAWLSWRLGIAPSTARQHVRVALRLREFPATRERFAAGTLSYSKVRAITRCGEPSAEELLLAWADDATAQQLEAIARGFRTAERAKRDAAVAGEVEGQRCSVRARSVGDGRRSLTISGPDEVIVAIEDDLHRLAEVLVADRLGLDADEVADPPTQPSAGRCVEADPGDGRSPLRVTADEKVEAVASALAAAATARTTPDTTGLDRHTLVLHASIDDLTRDGGSAPGGGGAQAEPSGIVPLADEHRRIRGMDRRTLRRLACDAGVVLLVEDADGCPLDVGRRRRTPTAALRRALRRRDRGCTFPGCHATRHLHAHHVHHWADGGPTDRANLVLLCGFHHRFVHAADWHIEVRPDGRHLYRRGAGATPVERIGAPPGASAGAVAAAAPGTASAEALRPPDHLGGPYDLDVAVAVLQRVHEAARQEAALAA